MGDARHIKYLALAHKGKILASHLHWDKDVESSENYEDTIRTIFEAPGWAAMREQKKTKLELKSGNNTFCMEVDNEGRVFIAVITRGYPKSYVFSSYSASSRRLMSDFASHVTSLYGQESLTAGPNGLKKSLRPFLRELATRFDDIEELDRLASAHAKVESVKIAVGQAINAASERQALLERVDDKTRRLRDSSAVMFHRAQAIHRRANFRRWSIMCKCAVIVCIVIFVIVAVVLGLNYSTYNWW